ncbi:MAG: Hsp70 family protein [Deltaproteobacteria bacterium]|jgi:molecular chaperone DnaK (HSP70)|nr:Hsp70 family protein [Deltaproteobacteria bacterium]MDL1986797.1 Hsp70 family protein [Deltaproteobacteria bacterium]
MEPIIGIDLGTTNSEVAFIFDGTTEIITDNDNGILPSCVSIGENGNIIVGAEAGNQALINPEKTVLSVKRCMGTDQKLKLGELSFSPQEISAFILKELKERAEKKINRPVSKAVITVPAYFTDDQRQATREAGEIAGLEVVRIINEPTAASLAYESTNPETQRVLVYDFGGGTFDVSIVKIEAGVVEVLSSTGDNHLGGDDFDLKIVDHLVKHMETEFDYSVKDKAAVMARLKRAAEGAKIQLSSAPYTTIEEDHIGKKGFKDLHLSLELSRTEFEEMIEEDLVRTMESVNKALKDAAMLPSAINKIILVGGSTRIPRISQMLEEKIGHLPHSEIDPDLCVGIGAGMQAGREMGLERSGVLVDITPYTFGTSAIGEVDGEPSKTMFAPLIRRNTKLPARKSDVFYTMVDNQEAVDVRIYQGEAPDALDNILLGNYMFDLTRAPSGSEIILHFDLDLNGILKIKAVEKKTGNKINAVIENAISRFTDEELSQTQDRINGLWTEGRESETPLKEKAQTEADVKKLPPEYADIVRRAEGKLEEAFEDDRDEMINLIEDIRDALSKNRMEDAETFKKELDDILFYMG